MTIFKVLIILIVFIISTFVLGKIKIKDKIKKYILGTISVLYNGFVGFIDTYAFIIIWSFLANMPKGKGYEFPESERGFNFAIGLIIAFVYIILVIPINIYARRKGKIDKKIYTAINIIATIIGIALFWIIRDKSKTLF